MAHTKSAKKRIRQNIKRRMRNKALKSLCRTRIKELEELISREEIEKAKEKFIVVQKTLAKVAQKRVIHKNTAQRQISRLHKKLNELAKKKAGVTVSAQA